MLNKLRSVPRNVLGGLLNLVDGRLRVESCKHAIVPNHVFMIGSPRRVSMM